MHWPFRKGQFWPNSNDKYALDKGPLDDNTTLYLVISDMWDVSSEQSLQHKHWNLYSKINVLLKCPTGKAPQQGIHQYGVKQPSREFHNVEYK